MTVQTISVPLPQRRRDTTDAAEAGSAVPAIAAAPCAHAGSCDRDACGQAERVTLRCPSLDTPTASPL